MFSNRSWIIFVLVLCWNVALLVTTSQPVQANDGFFFDGAAAHQLFHGGFFNPSIAHAYAISGTQQFGACPPVYQLLLLAWMRVAGTSVLSITALHLLIFILFGLILWKILQRLQTPAWCVNLSACLLLTISWSEGPDCLAHCFGMLGIYACIRAFRILDQVLFEKSQVWGWIMALCATMAFCASLEIGGIYIAILLVMSLASWFAGRVRPPILPLLAMLALPVVLVYLARTRLPGYWAGMEEYLKHKPLWGGFHQPELQNVIKILRTVPGLLLVAALLPSGLIRRRVSFSSFLGKRFWLILIPVLAAAECLVAASLFAANSNALSIANYFQCLIVATYLGYCVTFSTAVSWLKNQIHYLIPAIALGSLTMIGMSTWGVACTMDVRRSDALLMVEQEIGGSHPSDYKVVMSSAFLYDSAIQNNFETIDADCLAPPVNGLPANDLDALLALKPRKLILTQRDYFLRFSAALDALGKHSEMRAINVINKAIRRTPDSIKYLQQAINNVSWAPVVVDISWNSTP